ncbi:MAG: hypothetical protein GY812_13605 [Actinomycetia bacterium]|nr:hypothetical protein [Actinomycetes bacterium]
MAITEQSQPPVAAGAAGRSQQEEGGILYEWGPQAWIDMVMSKRMLVDRGGPMVPYTFLPILRMSADPAQIDRDWAEIRECREKVRLLDSPRQRWRKRYGNFVREIEWALLELRKHFTQEQYEEIVVGTAVSLAHENSSDFLEMMNKMTESSAGSAVVEGASSEPSRRQKLAFEMFNPAGFLTGPAEITEYDPGGGQVTMFIPDCGWHSCGKREDLPNPDKLPEEGCLLICKATFEELFDGEESPLTINFEPHLPDTSCTARMSWKPKA